MSPEMQNGIEKEPEARDACRSWLTERDPSAKVEEKGLMGSPKWPPFACSPDGIVESEVFGRVLLEIKVLSAKTVNPTKFDTDFDPRRRKSFYLYRKTDMEIQLKQSHSYYYQVQFSLAVLELTTCHFSSGRNLALLLLKFNLIQHFGMKKVSVFSPFTDSYLSRNMSRRERKNSCYQ